MTQMIFVNLPVADVERSAAFYEALGFVRDMRFSQPGMAAAMVLSDSITFMILSHDHFSIFSPRPIADAHSTAQALFCLSRDSRDEVDATIEKAVAAGGKADLKNKQGDASPDFMYGRNFEDLDGHVFEIMWMDVDAAMRAWGVTAPAPKPVAA